MLVAIAVVSSVAVPGYPLSLSVESWGKGKARTRKASASNWSCLRWGEPMAAIKWWMRRLPAAHQEGETIPIAAWRRREWEPHNGRTVRGQPAVKMSLRAKHKVWGYPTRAEASLVLQILAKHATSANRGAPENCRVCDVFARRILQGPRRLGWELSVLSWTKRTKSATISMLEEEQWELADGHGGMQGHPPLANFASRTIFRSGSRSPSTFWRLRGGARVLFVCPRHVQSRFLEDDDVKAISICSQTRTAIHSTFTTVLRRVCNAVRIKLSALCLQQPRKSGEWPLLLSARPRGFSHVC